jgi:hypothetical protein
MPSDEPLYGENREKKERYEEKKLWEILCALCESLGGGRGGRSASACMRACVHAPFDLPPCCLTPTCTHMHANQIHRELAPVLATSKLLG